MTKEKAPKRFFVSFRDCRKEVGVGDTVFTQGRNGDNSEEKIAYFGVKYMTLEGRRKDQYDMNTGSHNSQYSRTLWSSKAAFDAHNDREHMIRSFKNILAVRRDCSIEQFRKAAEALGLSEELELEFKKGRR